MKLRNSEALRAYVGKGRGKVMTAAELARRVGKSRGTIDHMLKGRMDGCSKDLAKAIEQHLEAPKNVIFLHESDPLLVG